MARKTAPPPPPPTDNLMSLADVAAYCQVAERTVYLWAQQGRIPSFKLGNLWRFRKADLDQWFADQQAATPRKSK